MEPEVLNVKPILLSEISPSYNVKRDGPFNLTMFPASSIPLSLCYALNKRTVDIVNANSNITALITLPRLTQYIDNTKGVISCDYPAQLYYEIHNKLVEEKKINLVQEKYISSSAKIASSAVIGENVIINDNVEISHNVQIDDNTIIGANTFVGPNVVIGTKGMQNLRVEGKRANVLYAGGVKIGERCEVLTNAIIQRPYQAFFTEIGDDTQVSVKVSIGHGSKIGQNCMIAGNGTIAGNVIIGDNVWMGPSATIRDGLTIGTNAKIMIGSIVTKDVYAHEIVSGNFATDHTKQLKNYAKIRKL
jgi:UDP-3-O-[3-hydroxymyristoyl] glucosamine N-acyltransferase